MIVADIFSYFNKKTHSKQSRSKQRHSRRLTTTCRDYLNFMICIRCFCRFSMSTGNAFMNGAILAQYMVLRRIVYGAVAVLNLESTIHRKCLN